ncbi:unnamed protein product [Echinostoma caproni]|uniref:Uncharacterized protein n=1 Tax=Echinostoma caproni TaxID=27848 RepID=A0A183B797_9TREM|nr:unnamed protein product [Echinostoma caproni]
MLAQSQPPSTTLVYTMSTLRLKSDVELAAMTSFQSFTTLVANVDAIRILFALIKYPRRLRPFNEERFKASRRLL